MSSLLSEFKNNRGKIILLIFFLFFILVIIDSIFINSLVLAQGGGSGRGNGSNMRNDEDVEKEAIAVETTKSKLGNFADYITVSARTEAVREVILTARLQEVVKAVNVEVGDKVKTGDILIELDNRNTNLNVIRSEAALENAKANLKLTLDGPRLQEIEQKEAELEKAESELELQREDYNRKKQLFDESYISKQEFDVAANKLTNAKSNYQTILKSLELMKIGPKEEEIISLRSQIKQAEANLEEAKIEDEYSKITAPIAGIISDIGFEKGQLASSGSTVIITDIDQIELVAYVNEININKIKSGENVNVKFRSLSKDFSGIVKSISPRTADNRQSFPVRVVVNNEDNIIKAGMSAQVELRTARADNVILLSQNAILEEKGINYVFIVENDKAIKKEIEISMENEEMAVIKTGIEAGQEVITLGKDNLSSGSLIKIVNRGDS